MTPCDPPAVLVVAGPAGAGKTTVARALAERWACTCVEGDDLHDAEAVRRMAGGIPLDDAARSPWLARVGAAAAAAVAASPAPAAPVRCPAAVVACSALARRYRDALCEAVQPLSIAFALLLPPEAVLAARLEARAAAGGHFMPPALLPSQLAALELGNDVIVFRDTAPPAAVAAAVARVFAAPA